MHVENSTVAACLCIHIQGQELRVINRVLMGSFPTLKIRKADTHTHTHTHRQTLSCRTHHASVNWLQPALSTAPRDNHPLPRAVPYSVYPRPVRLLKIYKAGNGGTIQLQRRLEVYREKLPWKSSTTTTAVSYMYIHHLYTAHHTIYPS